MAINIAVLAKKTAPLIFEFDGETVNAEFYPHKITPVYKALLNKLDGDDGIDIDEDSKIATAKMLSDLIVKWDVMAGDEPAPLDYKSLVDIPLTLLGATCSAIWRAVGKLMNAETGS